MNNKEFLDKEREVLKQIPRDELGKFIENNGARMREIITDYEEWDSEHIIDALIEWYKGI